MIKLFRRIRQNLLAENRFNKYLVYAIGETILVVIGILIALQINAWNEGRKNLNLSETYLKNIRKDLVSDTTVFHAGIGRINRSLFIHQQLSNRETINKLTVDSISSAITISMHSVRVYKITNSTFSKVTNSGFVESKKYSKLFAAVNEYYTREYNTWLEYLAWDKESNARFDSSEFLTGKHSAIDFMDLDQEFQSSSETESENAMLFRDYIKSPHFRNYLRTHNSEMRTILERMTYQKKIAEEMITNIDEALNN